ncbi:hypothetical protein NDU88_002503 [Pleurodeles waltl]|uniref:Uncharacterized protein n=1 Tax=Pleurodeles waltl TaxID=8319 RepID=A0AAV7WQF8_PLEWA|nr:hypothetical protein NDU88_002503 [Pleurodeles waltl]
MRGVPPAADTRRPSPDLASDPGAGFRRLVLVPILAKVESAENLSSVSSVTTRTNTGVDRPLDLASTLEPPEADNRRNGLVVGKKETSILACWKMIHSLLHDYAALDGSDEESEDDA